jgi:RNA polymerase sigma-70 factor (ECF subfamily)
LFDGAFSRGYKGLLSTSPNLARRARIFSKFPRDTYGEAVPVDRPQDIRTSVTLLGRLKRSPQDEAAWVLFVERYGPLILKWARAWKLQMADAEEVTQQVLLKLVTALKRFEYDPGRGTFRGFLYTATHRLCVKLVSSPQFRERKGGSEIRDLLAQREARVDLADRLAREYDQELMPIAFRLVEQRVKPHVWRVFYLRCVLGRPGSEVAREEGMKVATVHSVAGRVQRKIKDEIRRLAAEELGPGSVPAF